MFIALFLLADLALAVFAVRQCTGRKPAATVRAAPETEKPKIVQPPPAKPRKKPLVIQVEILNGCGVPGIADRFTDYLRNSKLDVVRTGNYEAFGVTKTLVIDRRGNLADAVRVAKTLGLPKERVLQGKNDSFPVDVTVILGSDFRQLSSWEKMEKDHAGTRF